MARLLALLTIPLLALGNGLLHSHGDAHASSDRSVQPHFHLGCSHCDHEHGDGHEDEHHHGKDDHDSGDHDSGDHDSGDHDSGDHDSDAVYFSGGQFYVSHAAETQVESSAASEFLFATFVDARTISFKSVTAHEVPIPDAAPLFLLHAALRL